ncbi:MAG: hypothetical protein ACD_33C00002G0012 [uncultured bacterium]|nr:MAG: hypothetical protein ACD_33C00002G0012 [uncultured bacterium]
MEQITHAPAYVAFYPMIAEIARENGYSLTIHGSVGKNKHSDLDLVAIPWIDDAKDSEELISSIFTYCNKVMIHYFEHLNVDLKPSLKPHGRKTWKIYLGNGASLDISVMPKQILLK